MYDSLSAKQAAKREMQMNDIFAAPARETDPVEPSRPTQPSTERLTILANERELRRTRQENIDSIWFSFQGETA